jgi:hypothetical protein
LIGLVILEQFFSTVPTKIGRCAISVKLIDDSHLVIDLFDILSALVFANLNVDVSFHDEPASVVQLKELIIKAVEEHL